MKTSVAVGTIVTAFLLVAACSVDVDISNKPCPCGDGYVCNTATNTCLTPAQLKALPSATPAASGTISAASTCDPANDQCPQGSYCGAKKQCIPGCRASADCAAISPLSPLCAVDRHQCVSCLAQSDCKTAGQTCSPSGVCVVSCGTGNACAGGGTCCAGLCVDTTQDSLNCGACGKKCTSANGSPQCTKSSCAATCGAPNVSCGSDPTACDVDTSSDANNCGGCGISCAATLAHVADPTCTSGGCGFTKCAAGFGNFDSNQANGCETPCGTFGAICCPNRQCTQGGCSGNSNNGAGKCN